MNHPDEARRLLGRSTHHETQDAVELSADLAALTHATLELAEQQRIGNLIALEALAPGSTNLRNLAHKIGRTQYEH